MFNASRSIETNPKYGLSLDEIDTHMMKNMEWGAVVYLSHSKYGRYESSGECISSGCEIWVNNNNNYKTGCAGNSALASGTSSCNQWNSSLGVNASTSGTIYGIYDMSGGAWEYVMGNMVDSSGKFYPGNSGLSQPESKYYDSYAYGTSNKDYSRGKLGDATKEVYNWYKDFQEFPMYSWLITSQWFTRGGYYNGTDVAGAFCFASLAGGSAGEHSWRVVLSAD